MPLEIQWPETRYTDKGLPQEKPEVQDERVFSELAAALATHGLKYDEGRLKVKFDWVGWGRRYLEVVYEPEEKQAPATTA